MNKYPMSDVTTFGLLMREKANVAEFVNPSQRQNALESQAIVEVLSNHLLNIRYHKVKSYGNRRYHALRSRRVELAMLFCDLQRKMDRLEALVFNNDSSTEEDLIDAVSDLAGYGLMGLELVFYLWANERRTNALAPEEGMVSGDISAGSVFKGDKIYHDFRLHTVEQITKDNEDFLIFDLVDSEGLRTRLQLSPQRMVHVRMPAQGGKK